MENKYYTPTKDEFHKGFEFEWKDPLDEGGWEKGIQDDMDPPAISHGSGYCPFGYALEQKSIRIKFLDREDIESLGWEYDNNAEPIPPREGVFELPTAFILERDKHQYQLFLYKDGTVWIDYTFICGGMGYIFKGTIKNKSELFKLMQMIGIKP